MGRMNDQFILFLSHLCLSIIYLLAAILIYPVCLAPEITHRILVIFR